MHDNWFILLRNHTLIIIYIWQHIQYIEFKSLQQRFKKQTKNNNCNSTKGNSNLIGLRKVGEEKGSTDR